jgi:NAD(P)-dependent dehydrogenase (short-subunit alcohol dehydrogenase family)
MHTLAAYSAARAAQFGYVQAVGGAVAARNVQINLIARNYGESKDHYPPENRPVRQGHGITAALRNVGSSPILPAAGSTA